MNHLGRALTEYDDPPVDVLFVYNCNPLATAPDQRRVLRGLERENLFTVVFEQVMTDTALYADVILPATTFMEGYDFAKAYGPISMELARPVIDAVGQSRPNADVFGELCSRLDLLQMTAKDEPGTDREVLQRCRNDRGLCLGAVAPAGRPARARSSWTCSWHPEVNLFPQEYKTAPWASIAFSSTRQPSSIRSRSFRRRVNAPSARPWRSCRGPTSSCG